MPINIYRTVREISNAVDGSEDSLIWKEIPRDLSDSNVKDGEPKSIYRDGDDVDDLDPFSDLDDYLMLICLKSWLLQQKCALPS